MRETLGLLQSQAFALWIDCLSVFALRFDDCTSNLCFFAAFKAKCLPKLTELNLSNCFCFLVIVLDFASSLYLVVCG